jgi:glycosyltransferase involved in cell wall biosynthesis
VTSVGILVDQLYAPAPGGMGTYVRELVPAMRHVDPSLAVTLFHARFEGPEPPEPWMDAFPLVEVPGSARSLYPGWAAVRRPSLPEALADLDLIHSPLPAAVPPTRAGQKLVVTVHDVAFLFHPEVYPAKWRTMYRAALRRIERSADGILTVSRHTADDLVRRRHVDPARIHVVPLAASLPATPSDVEETLARLKVRRPYVLFVGTLEPRKNLVRLVRAYRRAVAAGAGHALVLAGPLGWGRHPLLTELEREGPGSVILTGETRPEDLDALYRGADLFVYPSLYEGFGLPVLEAMSRGTPCVVSTASSLPEVAGEAAVPVDPRSTAGLAQAMQRVLGDPALAGRLREAGLARAASFRWEATATRTLEVYRRVLEA